MTTQPNPEATAGQNGGEAFDQKYHAKHSRNPTKRDTKNPCLVCGWAEHMAIHDKENIHPKGKWAHNYLPE